MRLLRTLTLIYTAVLVLVLAASLVAIWVYLRRIAHTLGKVHTALASVKDESEPLDQYLQRLHDVSASSAEELAKARASLARADERLDTLAGQLGASEAMR